MSENVKIVPATCSQCGGTVEVEKDKIVVQGFMKMFGIMCAVMMAVGMVMFVYYQVTDTGESTESEYSESYENDSDYNITEGVIIDEQDT